MLLFPQPTKEIVDLAEDNDVHVMYDVAHVFGLVFGRRFENPMDAGVAVMTTSTHKTFPGPQGGVVFSRAELSGKIGGVLSRVIANPHPNRIPALAIALEEIVTFGEEYASQIVSDAKALASALNERDIPALCEHRGFTETHQVVVDVSKHMSGEEAMLTLRKSGIFCTQTKIPKDEETGGVSGLRLGTAEVARLGMGISEMVEIAELIGRAVVDRKNVEKEVAELKKPFRHVKYCFDEAGYAYDYPLGMAVSSSHQG